MVVVLSDEGDAFDWGGSRLGRSWALVGVLGG
jgi:hypothetical protein